jgi:hypothetical protein
MLMIDLIDRRAHLFVAMVLLGLAGCADMAEFKPAMEVSCFQAARVSLKEAVSVAEEGGGRAIDVGYRPNADWGCAQDHPGVYDVRLYVDGEIRVVSVHARSMAMGSQEEKGMMLAAMEGSGHEESSLADMALMVPGPSIDISKAVDIAERHGGKAMAAWIEPRNGQPGYRVKLAEHGRIKVTWVNALY